MMRVTNQVKGGGGGRAKTSEASACKNALLRSVVVYCLARCYMKPLFDFVIKT